MRKHLAAACVIAILPAVAQAAWVAISSDAGKRVEIDPSSVRKEEGAKLVVLGRIFFDKELTDPRTNGPYKSIEALTRYDCANRTYVTLKRTWRSVDGELLREEEVRSGSEMPVRTGSLDDKMLREVCRPRTPGDQQAAASKLVDKANAAATDLRKANEAMLQKEAQKGVKNAALATPAKEAAAPAPGPAAATAAAAPVVRAPAPRPRPVRRPAPETTHDAVRQHAHIHWDYEGEGRPDNWGKLKSEYATCASGKRQSPIDIRDGIRVDQPAIDFAWRPSQFRIVDNGHTVQAGVSGSSISLLGKQYELLQFHFHRPAEERINGRGFEMVAHFVHRAEDGRLAVVAVLMESGAENPFIQTLWNHLPLEKHQEVSPPTTMIDPSGFLPADRGYYSYMGSLTTPPCTEDVLWLVMKQPVQVSAEQIAIFSRLYRNNARPVQPGFGRLIKESR
ncbi:MAG: carbonic anhydrase family protein [Rhodocyclaceae bacterium]|nr:carbonic anhydrase family protein [Rhodocyclaceae bacterium]